MTESEQISTLSYAIRFRVVLKYLGQLMLVQAALILMPLLVSMMYGESEYTLRFGIVILGLVIFSLPWLRTPKPDAFQDNEALVITVLAFLIGAISMIYPFRLANLSMPDAFFEAISAITTTGLTTIDRVTEKSGTFLFTRSWMQWYGGLGIVVLSLAILRGNPGISRKLIDTQDQENPFIDLSTYARKIFFVYCILTGVVFIALFASGNGILHSLIYSLSSVSTGGFDSLDASTPHNLSVLTQSILIAGSLLGSITLILYFRAYQKGIQNIFNDIETRTLLYLIMASFLLLTWFMRNNLDLGWIQSGWNAFFLTVSAQTTTGFSTYEVSQLDPSSKIILILSMFTGGEIGSTAGGIKILRLLIIIQLVHHYLVRTALPSHAVVEPRLAGQKIEPGDFSSVFIVLSLYVFLILISWLLFTAMGMDPLNSLFEVMSATCTVGLSTGLTASDLHPLLKAVLGFDMLAGRLEIIALFVLIYPRTWLGKRTKSK